MPDMPSITIVKRFPYRGQPEEFSNRYHFSGTTPATDAAWKALADAIILAERPTVRGEVEFIKAYGYAAGVESSVAQIDYTLAPNVILVGTGSFAGSQPAPGDVAATTRWYTGASSNGKKVYCRKYWHGVLMGTGVGDTLLAAQRTAFDTFGNKLIDGTLPGTFKYSGPQGATLQAAQTSPYLTTRSLKRRGKRPPTSP